MGGTVPGLEEAAIMVRGPDGGDPLDFLSEPPPPPQRSTAEAEQLKRLRQVRQQRLLRAGLVALVLVVLIVFVLQNAHPVRVDLLFVETDARLIWVIVVCAALGGVVGYLLGKPPRAERAGGGKGRSRRR
ncbi:MAG: LapA family protein [Actinomycetota bacterium]